MNIVLIPLLAAGVLTFAITPLVIWLAKRWGLVDDPRRRYHPANTHKGIIPRAGGLALFLGVALGTILFIPLTKLLVGMLVGGLILTVVGLFDDKRDIDPYLRMATNTIAVLILVGSGAGIPFITNPLTGGTIPLDTWRITFTFFGQHSLLVWADILAFIWIMWTINIVGWSAGVDGQMPGFAAICAFVLGMLSLRFSINDPSQLQVTILAFIIAGSFLGFIPWNFYPQKIMPGYGGKTLTGFLLALLGILSYGKFGTALLVLGIPTADAIYTLLRRIGQGKSPVWADRGHLHHHLLDLGWGKRRIALFYWGVSAILGALALTVTSQQKVFTLLLIGVIIGGFLIWVRFFSQFSKPRGPDNG
ncbi:MAG: MraY family glycosyltransferase [bacterium]|nr:MraY family glycosyltransferase [bacterium]